MIKNTNLENILQRDISKCLVFNQYTLSFEEARSKRERDKIKKAN